MPYPYRHASLYPDQPDRILIREYLLSMASTETEIDPNHIRAFLTKFKDARLCKAKHWYLLGLTPDT